MYYAVFSKKKNSNGAVEWTLHKKHNNKQEAFSSFNTEILNACRVHSPACTLYFVGFSDYLPFIKEIKEPTSSAKSIMTKCLANLSCATFLNVFEGSGYKSDEADLGMAKCEGEECDVMDTVKSTVYGKLLCNRCWAKYRTTRASLAEYVIGITNGTYAITSFTINDVKAMVSAWKNDTTEGQLSNRSLLLRSERYTAEELSAIEVDFDTAVNEAFSNNSNIPSIITEQPEAS